METKKVKVQIQIECENCYEYFIVEAKTGIYKCSVCGCKVDLEIID